MARVFISHASKDLSTAVIIQDWLREQRHQVFLDHDIQQGIEVGEVWKRRLYRELRAADAVVCVVTRSYVRSEWCSAEIGIADTLGARLLPVRLQRGVTSRLLDGLQYVDLFRNDRWRDQLASSLRSIDIAGGVGWEDGRSPFPGLRPFDSGMARVFYGRGWEIRDLTNRLRSLGDRVDGGLLLVVGPSGCGKSSLVRAGLLERIAHEPGWSVAHPCLPGTDPVGALARALTTTANRIGMTWTVAATRARLDRATGLAELADELMVAHPVQPRERLLLTVDQGEELFTRADAAARAQFVALLRGATAGPVRVVMTLRAEFSDRLLQLHELDGMTVETIALRPLARDTLRVVIEEPARMAGLTIDRQLVAQLVADTAGGEALPLLAFALNRLGDGLSHGDALSAGRYHELGGVRGAVTRHADAMLDQAVAASGLTAQELVSGLARLATIDETGQRARRRVVLADLAPPLRKAFDVFVDGRLLTTDADERGEYVGVTHEALLTAWPPLDAAIGDRTAAVRLSRALELASAEWDRVGRPADHLWEPGRAGDASQRVSPADLGGLSADFLVASQRRGARNRRRALALLSAVLLIVTAGGATALLEWRIAVSQREDAQTQRQLAVGRELVGKALVLRANQPRLALALSIEAYDIAPSLQEAQDNLLSTQADYYDAILRPNRGAANDVAFSPDGSRLASAEHDDAICVWRMPRRDLVGCPATTSPAVAVGFSPDGRLVAAAGGNGHLSLWDATSLTARRDLPVSADALTGLAMDPAGPLLATGDQDGHVTVIDIRTLATVASLVWDPSPVTALAFSPDGTRIVASSDSSVTFWDLATRSPTRLAGYTGAVRALAFSPDGNRIASGSDAGAVTLWDARTGATLATATENTDPVLAVAFSPDGRLLATGGDDAAVRLWDVSAGRSQLNLITSLTGQTRSVLGIAVSPDSQVIVSAGADSVVGLWNASGPADANLPAVLNAATYGPGGRLATAGRDRRPRLWSTVGNGFAPVPGARSPRADPPSGPSPYGTFGMAFSPDGSMLAAPATDASAVVWNPLTGQVVVLASDRASPVRAVAFDPRSGYLVSAGRAARDDVGTWQVSRQTQVQEFPPIHGDGPIDAVAVDSRPGAQLSVATGGEEDGVIAIADTSGRPAHVFYGRNSKAPVEALAFSPDGRLLVSGSNDGTIAVWDVASRDSVAAPPGTGRPVVAASFDAAGHRLATTSDDGVIKIWDVLARRPIATLTARPGTTAAVFPPGGDGLSLTSADQTGTPLIWDLDVTRVRARLCAAPRPVLTAAEWAATMPGEPYREVCQ